VAHYLKSVTQENLHQHVLLMASAGCIRDPEGIKCNDLMDVADHAGQDNMELPVDLQPMI